MKISDLKIGDHFTTTSERIYVLQAVITNDNVTTYRYMRRGTGTGFKTVNANLKVTLLP